MFVLSKGKKYMFDFVTIMQTSGQLHVSTCDIFP